MPSNLMKRLNSAMRIKGILPFSLCFGAIVSLLGFQTSGKVDRKQLRDMLAQLGYEVKDLDTTAGKEKYSFTVEQGGLNIPVAVELSPNESYIWFTVFCKDGIPAGDKAVAQLKRNADIQPSQFYITKSGKVMMGLCLENHEVTNAILRQKAVKIADDVVKSKDDWQ
jgi:hypothetical protein